MWGDVAGAVCVGCRHLAYRCAAVKCTIWWLWVMFMRAHGCMSVLQFCMPWSQDQQVRGTPSDMHGCWCANCDCVQSSAQAPGSRRASQLQVRRSVELSRVGHEEHDPFEVLDNIGECVCSFACAFGAFACGGAALHV